MSPLCLNHTIPAHTVIAFVCLSIQAFPQPTQLSAWQIRREGAIIKQKGATWRGLGPRHTHFKVDFSMPAHSLSLLVCPFHERMEATEKLRKEEESLEVALVLF